LVQYSSPLILKGNNSRENSSSNTAYNRSIQAKFRELEGDLLPKMKRFDSLNLKAANLEKDDAFLGWVLRV
jgi:hypothetical protein